MRPSALIMTFALCAALPMFSIGCASQQEIDKIRLTNRTLQEQVVRLEDERDTARANLDSVRAKMTQTLEDMDRLKAQTGALDPEMAKMKKDYEQMLRQIAELPIGQLPDELAQQLTQLAGDYPNQISFDPKLGMLRFASDFTFDSGSDHLRNDAQGVVQSLAGILNSTKATSFEVRIVGHTDNVPIEKPDTRVKHASNLHLSAHRAIAVCTALVSDGVDPKRCQIAGYGEFRPIVENGPKGAAANRRVEVFLVPMPTLAALSPTTDTKPATRATAEPMK